MHVLDWVQRLFPGHFKNFIFLAVGEVDAQSYEGEEHLRALRNKIEAALGYYTSYCYGRGLAATYYVAYGTDPVDEFTKLTQQVLREFPNSVCFASKLIFANVNLLTGWLHNETPLILQRRLHLADQQMMLVPMKVF